ncbi:MAG TPA: helix-turn-helix domain-containing protein [Candidatus Ruthenibacterium avium]|uniref:Helix-turn-helix domain-containing protein n=1 Tax=Candidatus Ruthenibacterium avium TaxID=2838751 RepID=A0A9D2M3C7_9FIRM|nr:helix-turn-helix domain-containing protein [Candidatus Ruthenibacterium avium]
MDKTYQESYRKLGLNIAFYRKDRGLTQMQLAELLDIDRSHMSAIELATVGVSLDVIFKLCNILNVSPKDLFDFRG